MSDNRFFLSARQIVVLLLALALVLLALFNNTAVPVSLLFTIVSVPLSVLVLGAILIGVLLGNVMAVQRGKRRVVKKAGREARKIAVGETEAENAEIEYAEVEEPQA